MNMGNPDGNWTVNRFSNNANHEWLFTDDKQTKKHHYNNKQNWTKVTISYEMLLGFLGLFKEILKFWNKNN